MSLNLINGEEILDVNKIKVRNGLSVGGSIIVGSGLVVNDPFPTGTRMYFNQTAAPAGWAKVPISGFNYEGAAIKLTTGALIGGTGLSSGTQTVLAHTHTITNHNHNVGTHYHTINLSHYHTGHPTTWASADPTGPKTIVFNTTGSTYNYGSTSHTFHDSGFPTTTSASSPSVLTTNTSTLKFFNVILCEKL